MPELYTHQPQLLSASSCLELVEFGIERIKNQDFTYAGVNGYEVSKFGLSIETMRNSRAAVAQMQLSPEDESVRDFAARFTDLGSCSLMGFKFFFGIDHEVNLPPQTKACRTTLLSLAGDGGFKIYPAGSEQHDFTEVITAPGDQLTVEPGATYSGFGIGNADNPRIVAYFYEGQKPLK